ncbi:MAG: hypothetical protein D6732_13650 [Methanobacteriota archaeon]|nr:MAG: hypothetical protein D6732_13650 [Euryarchaeota archaeon]
MGIIIPEGMDTQEPTGSGAVHITSMHTSALPRVVYFNYLTPPGELLGQKFVDASNNEEDHFFIKDHLGNIRVTLSETGAVLASEDFAKGIPSGLPLRQSAAEHEPGVG